MWMGQESSSRQARFALVEGCDEYVAPFDRMGTIDLRARKNVVKLGPLAWLRLEENADRNLTFPRKVGFDRRSWEGDRLRDQ